MMDLIIMTILLSIGMSIYLYIFTRKKYFCIFLAIFGTSAAIPLFFHLKYNFGHAWTIWIVSFIVLILAISIKYPEKMKKWEKDF